MNSIFLAENLKFGGKFECWREDYLGDFRFTTSGDAISGDATSGHFRSVSVMQLPVTSLLLTAPPHIRLELCPYTTDVWIPLFPKVEFQ
jgi:hypothetical protein